MSSSSAPGFSSLPGWLMPSAAEDDPPATHVVDYLERYERRYDLPVHHGTEVVAVEREDACATGRLAVSSRDAADERRQTWRARVVVSATGTWGRPFVHHYPKADRFGGEQLHSAEFRTAEPYAGRRGRRRGWRQHRGSAARRDLARGRHHVGHPAAAALPARRRGRSRALQGCDVPSSGARRGRTDPRGVAGLGDVVMVESVRAARDAVREIVGRLDRNDLLAR
jgi:putative flavoprotein involved in K+ transport